MKEISAFKIKIHPLHKSEFLSIIRSNLEKKKKTVQIGINSASVNEIVKNEELRKAVNNTDLVNIDGISVTWALRFLGHSIPERVATPDLADDVLKMAENEEYGVFLFGARENIILLCRERLRRLFPKLKISGSRNGYYQADEETSIVEFINATKPDILLLGMPSPQKELFYEKYKHQLYPNYILGVGGYFDILSGLIRRAPKWIQKAGLEWLYRFLQEPGRLWRRYLLGNTKFLWLAVKEKLTTKNKRFAQHEY